MTGIQYRIVQKTRTVTGISQSNGTVDETDREDISAIVRTGTMTKTPEQIGRQTASSLEFYDDEAATYEYGSEEYLYYLQTFQDGKWCDVKSLRPAPYPEDDEEDEEDEDSLAGDIDDGSHYVPDANPLTTPHYFALKGRGDI
jgi:hypothetical protein